MAAITVVSNFPLHQQPLPGEEWTENTPPPSCPTPTLTAASIVSNSSMNFTENQHGNGILERLKQQKESSRFCDVVLHVQGRQYLAHRNVLAACSPYFDSILKVHHIVKEQLTITCQNHEVFQLLLNYMYTGHVVIDKNNVSELLKLANHFLVSKLKNYCAEYLDRYLDATNCLSVKELAEKYNMPALVKNATHFLLANVNEVLLHTEVLTLGLAKVEAFLTDKNVSVSSENLLKFILRWIHHDLPNREKNIRFLLSFVAWEKLSPIFVQNLIETDCLFKESPGCLVVTLQVLRENNVPLSEKFEQLSRVLEERCGTIIQQPNGELLINLSINTDDHERMSSGKGMIGENSHNNNGSKPSIANSRNRSLLKASENNAKVVRLSRSQSPHRRKSTPVKLRIAKQQENEQRVALKRKPGRPKKSPSDEGLKHKKTGKTHQQKLLTEQNDKLGPEEDDDERIRLSNELEEIDDGSDEDSDSSLKYADDLADKRQDDDLEKEGIKCVDCCYVANSQARLYQHREKAHANNTVFCCTLCEFSCKWNREYYMHMKTHFTGPPFKCDQCDYSTDRIQPILSHRMKHTDEKPFRCTQCNYRCRTKNNLTAHTRSHTGEKPFKCHQCGRCFAIKSTLDQHLVTHSDVRPYLCDQCGFSTKYQSHLIAHKRIHTGDVYTCQYPKCNYSSPKKSQLKAHMRTHAAIRSHICSSCGRGFVEKSHLVRHERIHLEEKPFRCQSCEYGSSRRDKLKEHVLKHHGDNATIKAPYKARKQRRTNVDSLFSLQTPASKAVSQMQAYLQQPTMVSAAQQPLVSPDQNSSQSVTSVGPANNSPINSDSGKFDNVENNDGNEPKVFDPKAVRAIENGLDLMRSVVEMPRASIPDIPRSLGMEIDPRVMQQIQHAELNGLDQRLLPGMMAAGSFPGQQCDFSGLSAFMALF